jgi:hypothetical protein
VAKGKSRGYGMFVEIAIINVEAFRERILNLEEFEAYQTDG